MKQNKYFKYSLPHNYSVTFDDVLLSPAYSEIKPKEVDTSITIGKVKLHIPILPLLWIP